jgi:hypothetical protein
MRQVDGNAELQITQGYVPAAPPAAVPVQPPSPAPDATPANPPTLA